MSRERDATAGAPGNLGAEASRFLGRVQRLDDLQAALAASRLVTVTGTAGVGKTRLALEHARRRAPPGGAWRIDLSGARGEAEVAALVSAALGAGDDTVPALAAAMRARGPMLLILDGCERLVAPVASLLGALLSLAPELACLATSRRPLRLSGEQLFALSPLALPAGPHEVETAEASALFLDRARLEVGGLALDDEGARAVAEIAARLGGLPLAIELCASRLQVMTLPDLSRELSLGLAVLATGSRDDASRRGALRRAFTSSWELLSPRERSALAQASVFRGDFSLAAAERVLDFPGEAGAPPFLDVIEALVEHSLVARRTRDGGRQLRFRLYEGVRHFAAEALGEGTAGAQERHERWFLDRAEQAAAGDGETDGEDIVAALSHPLERPPDPGRAPRLLAAALAADAALASRGTLAARLALLDASIAAAENAASPPLALALVLVLVTRAEVLAALGRPTEAREDRRRAQDLSHLVPGARARAAVEASLAEEALTEGRLDDARVLADDALASHRALDTRRAEAEGLLLLARVLCAQGAPGAARDHAERAAVAARAAASDPLERAALAALGLAAHHLGDLDVAERCYTQARSYARSGEASLSTHLGALCLERGTLPEAHALLRHALAEQRARGDHAGAADALAYLGIAEEAQGLAASARARYEEAAALHRDAERAPLEGLTLAWLARLEASSDRLDEARRALDEARSRLFAGGSADLLAVYDLCEAHLALAEARAARRRGDERAATTCLARAERVLAAHPPASLSVDVRLARASLARVIGPVPVVSPVALAPGVVVSASALWFRPVGGDRVSLATRRALRCILRRLAEERDARPGEPLEVPALLDAGWPGERVLHEAGVSRVYAAIAHLRRDGLRDVLVRRDDGYLLDPGVALAREPD